MSVEAIKLIEEEAEGKMAKTIANLKSEYLTIRAGRANSLSSSKNWSAAV